jgi:hypothetical protein
MATRMRRALEAAGAPTLAGGALEDAATGGALLGFFRRGRGSGAFDDADLAAAGLRPADLAASWTDLVVGRSA